MYLRLALTIFYPDLARARWIQGEFQLKNPSWYSAGTRTWILILKNYQLEYRFHFAKAYRGFVCACRVCFCVQNPSRFEEKSFVLTWNILLPISLFKIMFKYRSPDIETVYLLLLCSRELFQSKALYLQKYQAPKSVESWMNHQNLVLSSSILDAKLICK